MQHPARIIKRPILDRILIVEDDDDHAKIISRTLARYDVATEIERVRGGLEGLSYLRHEEPFEHSRKPDLILLDLKMPRMDGHEFLSIIKSDSLLKGIPVFIMSTSNAELDRHRAYENRADQYLVKPTELESFQELLERLKLYFA